MIDELNVWIFVHRIPLMIIGMKYLQSSVINGNN